MMKKINKLNRILAAVLIGQLIVVAVVFWPRSAATTTGGSLIPDYKADQVTSLTIRDGEGNQIRLVRKEGKWVLPEADDFPALESKVNDFLSKLAGLKTNRRVAETASSQKRLKVAPDEFASRIDFEQVDGGRHTLYIGSAASYNVTHVRLDAQPEVYLVSGLSPTDAGANYVGWIDTKYSATPADQIKAIMIENRNGQLKLVRTEAGSWTLEGLPADQALDETKVNSLTSRLAGIYMTRPLGKQVKAEYGLDKPTATITVLRVDQNGQESSYTLRIGAKNEQEGSYVISTSESPYIVQTSEYTVQEFLEWGQKDLVKPPATPSPQPTSQGK